MFPRLPARATFVADTNFVSGTQKMFLILVRNILCPQQMFPSLRNIRYIMSNNVSATMCPRLPVPLEAQTSLALSCPMIILRNSTNGDNIGVCIGIFTIVLVSTFNKNTPSYFHKKLRAASKKLRVVKCLV